MWLFICGKLSGFRWFTEEIAGNQNACRASAVLGIHSDRRGFYGSIGGPVFYCFQVMKIIATLRELVFRRPRRSKIDFHSLR